MSFRDRRDAPVRADARGDVGPPDAGRWKTLVVRGGRAAGWKLRNWPLRTKLLVILLIPTITALTLIGLRYLSETESANRLDELSVRVRTEAVVARLAHSLQRERDLTVRYVASERGGDGNALRTQRAKVDTRLGEFGKALSAAKSELSDGTFRAFKKLDDRLGVLTNLRFASEHSATPAESVLRAYSELIAALLEVRELSVATINEPELVRAQLAGTALARLKDQMSVSRALISEALESGTLTPDRKRMLHGSQAEVQAWRTDFRKFATPEQERQYEGTVTGLLVDTGNDIVESVLVRAENRRSLAGLDPEQWDTAATYTTDLVARVEKSLLVSMQERTDALAARAATAALRDAAMVLGALVIATLVTMIITRSLVRPLRLLRGTALEVAEHRLPAAVRGILADPQGGRPIGVAPVPVYTDEELGQVARAFDAVHGEAVRLAGEQAALRYNINAMFVNLSRRGQELAERQLAVLDRMEAGETDPETLAGLFELDHLATRMRRNSENILVLTGNDYARTLPGAVPASEVFGAALSEIEEYQRVQLASVPEIAVLGAAVSDVVHVISELLENATSGSASDTAVTVVSSVNHRGAWLVQITDDGPGMAQEALDEANARLVELPEIDVEATRRMGLYVVARLAQRNHIEVRLHSAPGGGLTATVVVPPHLITSATTEASWTPSVEPGRRPTWLESQATGKSAMVQQASASPVAAGPPKRAPVVADRRPSLPAVADSHPLDFDQPTERLPVYKDLLTRWFRAVGEPTPESTDVGGIPAASPSAPVPQSAEPPMPKPPMPQPSIADTPAAAQLPAPARPAVENPPAPEPAEDGIDAPTVINTPSLRAAIGVNSPAQSTLPQASEGVAPFRGELDLGEDAADDADDTGSSVTGSLLDLVKRTREEAGEVSSDAASERALSRSPEAVRSRMSSLADGRRRGRQAGSGEYADRGRTAAVGAIPRVGPEERAES